MANASAEWLAAMRGRLEKTCSQDVPAAIDAGSSTLAVSVASKAPRRSGRLAASVRKLPVRRRGYRVAGGIVVTGGHETPMVAEIEFGNEHQPPEAFIRPGAADVEKRLRADLADAVARSLS